MLDHLYQLLSRKKRFPSGWGDLQAFHESLETLTWPKDDDQLHPNWKQRSASNGIEVRLGNYRNDADGLPKEAAIGHVQWMRRSNAEPKYKRRLAIVAGGRSEHGFKLREAIWTPLLKTQTDLIFLETPWHGVRMPIDSEHPPTVHEQLRVNVATVRELQGLANWARGEGYDDITLVGYSMGAFMAGLAACHSTHPVRALLIAVGRSPVPAWVSKFQETSIDYQALGIQIGGDAQDARKLLAQAFSAADLDVQPRPLWERAVHLVAGINDCYLPIDGARKLQASWDESRLTEINTDHIGLIFFHRDYLRQALISVQNQSI